MDIIDELNTYRTHNDSAIYGITEFSDMSHTEFQSKILTKTHFKNWIKNIKIGRNIYSKSKKLSGIFLNSFCRQRRNTDVFPIIWNW